jgi:hypothetical protein
MLWLAHAKTPHAQKNRSAKVKQVSQTNNSTNKNMDGGAGMREETRTTTADSKPRF